MPPLPDVDLKAEIQRHVASNDIVIFSKSYCPFCSKVKTLFQSYKWEYFALEIDKMENGNQMQDALFELTGQRSVPNVYVKQQHIGGCDDVMRAHESGSLHALMSNSGAVTEAASLSSYDYDLIVLGGGSGGLAAAKEAADLGAKVCLLDFVKPSPQGTSWGLGGTCVNVGCIPKKLMHHAALLGESLQDAKKFGWELTQDVSHSWGQMKTAVQNYIASLNWGYRVQLKQKNVVYKNAYGEFVDAHTIKMTNKKGVEEVATGKFILVAVGGRPRYPDVPGAREYAISSDDLFSLGYAPGKTLCVGASYVSLECAGFLRGLGFDVTVMVRSILLRGFDQQMAGLIGANLEQHGVNMVEQCVPTKIERLEEGQPGLFKVTAKYTDGTDFSDTFNTVMFAVGRDAITGPLQLDKCGVRTNPKNGKVVVNEKEQSNVSHIFAIGDCIDGKPELTPVAIQAGKLLAKRLFTDSKELMDYLHVPTTVFTPLEYGCVGLSEEDAIARYGEDKLDVYHSQYTPLEHTVAERPANGAYAKLICLRGEGRVLGLHVTGPSSGEVTQGFALGMRLGATKHDFDCTVGIHPTCAETLTTLVITKRSGVSAETTGC